MNKTLKNQKDIDKEKVKNTLMELIELLEKNYKEEFEEIRDNISAENKTILYIIAFIIWNLKKNPDNNTASKIKNYLESLELFPEKTRDMLSYLSKVKKIWKEIVKIASECVMDEIEAFIILNEFGYESSYKVQSSIYELSSKLMDVQKNDKLAISSFSNYQFWIEKIIKEKNATQDVRIAIDGYNQSEILRIKEIVTGTTNIKHYWIDDFEEFSVDKVFMNLIPYGKGVDYFANNNKLLNILDEFPKGEISNQLSALGEAIYQTRNGGKIVAIITGGCLTDKLNEKVRQYLVEKGLVEGVIVLPEKMDEKNWSSLFIVVISRNNKKVRMLDARNFYSKGRIKGSRINIVENSHVEEILRAYNDDGTAHVVTGDSIKKEKYNLSPLRYAQNLNDSKTSLELGKVINFVHRGRTLSGKEIDDMYHLDGIPFCKCIQPSCIENGIIKRNGYISLENYKSFKKNIVEPGDLLITKSGNPFKIAICRDEYAVIGNVYIVKIDNEKMDSYYLKCFLESEIGQRELLKYSTGAKTPIISIENLRKVRIPLYSEETMASLSETARELSLELNKAYETIDKCNEEMKSLFD